MGKIITIYGTDIELPDEPDQSEIEDWGMPKEEQYWRRKKLPPIFNDITFSANGVAILNDEQKKFCLKELDRIRNGFWFYNNGEPTYITGRNYYYLQYWTLENKKSPEYRDASRRYFLYLDYWYKVYWCLGIIRGKGRRSGATSEGTSNVVREVTTVKNSKCGIVSKTSADARKVFIYRVQFGFRHLVFFLQPTLDSRKDSKTELVFAVPISSAKNANKGRLIDDVEGLNSMVDYQATALNSYDSERLTWGFIDEGGKWPTDVPFDQFVSIILETFVEGSEKRGFGEFPSTVNEMTKSGGAAFKAVWDDATWKKEAKVESDDDEVDEFDDADGEATANRLVRYFCPAYDGLAGFIDKYGLSIIDTPTEQQAAWLIEKYGQKRYNGQLRHGAKKFLELKRAKLAGKALEEEKRKYPFNEVEMFMAINADCIFSLDNLNAQIEYLKENPVHKRKILYYRCLETQKVKWRDIEKNESDFCWEWVGDLSLNGHDNKYHYEGQMRRPSRADIGLIGVDGISSEQGGKKYGSKASAWAFIKHDIKDPENTGLFTGHLFGRPKSKDDLHEQVMLCAEYHGFIVYWEFVADDYYTFFKSRGRLGYLAKFPLSAIDPVKRKKDKVERHYGFPTTDFAISKGHDAMITYVLYYYHKIYWVELCEDLKIYDQNKRTPHDRSVSAMLTLVGSLEPIRKPPPKTVPIIETYPATKAHTLN